MSSEPNHNVVFEKVFHPTDFTSFSEIAFAHALKLAIAAQAEVEIIHVASDAEEVTSHNYPSVHRTLARWGVLPEDASAADVKKAGVTVHKSATQGAHPATALLRELQRKPADLIVLSTHRRGGIDRWLHEEVANKVARRSGTMTLFVPNGVHGFVALQDGDVSLGRILLPVDTVPNPQLAVDTAATFAHLLACDRADFNLFHVGPQSAVLPGLRLPQRAGWAWGHTHQAGDVVTEILGAAEAYNPDLIVVTTQGHDSLLDVLRGSTTERILRAAHCPVLTIPASTTH